MARLGSPLFTFTWRIENFSMCPHPTGKRITSPTFTVDFLENTEWRIDLYPRGETDHNYVSIDLRRSEESTNAPDIKIVWRLTTLSTRGDKDIKSRQVQNTFRSGDRWSYRRFCNREKIFEQERGILPNDTLTLRCHMSRCVQLQETDHSVPQELNTDCWNSSFPFQRYESSARTRIIVSTTSFVWPIKRILDVASGVKLKTFVPFAIKRQRTLHVSLSLEEDSEKSISIEVCKKEQDGEGIFLRCHIRTVGAPKNVQFQGKDELYFQAWEENKVWRFPKFLKLKELTERYFPYTDGSLYLRFDLWRSKQYSEWDIECIDERFPLDFFKEREISGASTSNFAELYRSGELVDATLRVRDREYHVHKFILCAGSDVFRRMFQSGMKEQQSGVVDIVDLDSDTVERLIKYMYTYELGELSPEDAGKLYGAADKYNVESLKGRLCTHLTESLSVNTVCETLIVADAQQDDDLLAVIVDYMCKNASEIFHSRKWDDFTENRSSLAASVMLRVLTKK